MAITDYTQVFTTLTETLDREYDLEERPQFNRLGRTAKWFNARNHDFKGKAYQWPAYVSPTDSFRVNTWSAARAAEFALPRDMKMVQCTTPYTELREFNASIKINDSDVELTQNDAYAVAELASRLITETDAEAANRLNLALFQPACPWIAKVHTFYNVAGTSSGDTATGYNGHTAMYIRIKDGPIGAFTPGMVVQIFDATSTTTGTVNVLCKVHDVIYGKDGPPVAGVRTAGIGPGLVCEPCAVDGSVSAGSGYNTAWNAVGVPASGDYIIRYGEFDLTAGSGKNIHGLPDLFDTTVDIYMDESSSLMDREAAGNAWMNPETFTIAASGSEVAFDPTEHLRDAEDVLPQRISTARQRRSGVGKGPSVSDALVLILPPEIVNEGVRAAQGTEMFTSMIKMGLSEAKARQLVGESGFDGFVYHSPTLGSVALQADPAMPPYTGYIIEPNSFMWLNLGGRPGQLNWVQTGASKWHRIQSTDTLTHEQLAGVYFKACLICDQPAANICIKGIKSSKQ